MSVWTSRPHKTSVSSSRYTHKHTMLSKDLAVKWRVLLKSFKFVIQTPCLLWPYLDCCQSRGVSPLVSITESKAFDKCGPPSSTSSFSSLKLRAPMAPTRDCYNCLVCFLVMTVFGVVQLHLIMSHPRHPHPPPPCPAQPGIHWVRDPDSCSHYFICVASQPIRMPPCPPSTVWSVGARNCVPVHSRWDDCPHLPPPPPTPYSAGSARNWTAASDRMGALLDPLHPEDERRQKLLRASYFLQPLSVSLFFSQ